MKIKNLSVVAFTYKYLAVWHIKDDTYLYLGGADTYNKAGRICLNYDPFTCKVVETSSLNLKA